MTLFLLFGQALTAGVLSAISDIASQKLTGIQKLQLRRLALKVVWSCGPFPSPLIVVYLFYQFHKTCVCSFCMCALALVFSSNST